MANIVLLCLDVHSQPAALQPLTVADMVQMGQFVSVNNAPFLLSPDGKRFLAVVIRGDLAKGGSWVDLMVGSTDSLEAASNIETVAKLFTSSKERSDRLFGNPQWLEDNETLVFIWDDGLSPRQVTSLNVRTRQMRHLTHHPTAIWDFAVTEDQGVVIYAAEREPDTLENERRKREGFVVGDESARIAAGDYLSRTYTGFPYVDVYMTSPRQRSPVRIVTSERPPQSYVPIKLWLSPDGSRAIVGRNASRFPTGWKQYTEKWFREVGYPGAMALPESSQIMDYCVVNMQSREVHQLWNAPKNPYGYDDLLWEPDNRHIILGQTFLPPDRSDGTGLNCRAVADVDIDTGSFASLPMPVEFSKGDYPPADIRPTRWVAPGIVELRSRRDPNLKLCFEKHNGRWSLRLNRQEDNQASPAVRLELRQTVNTPPALFAVNPTAGTDRLILDPNPGLRDRFALGRVEKYQWIDRHQKSWTAKLYYPVNYVQGHRYPLVIQTHRGYDETFSLEGSHTTAFAAQPLANRGMAVLQVGNPDDDRSRGDVFYTPQEPIERGLLGYESAVSSLVESGLVDPSKVGIIGFSRTVWYVEYTLTHSQFAFAAAIAADGVDGSYLQYLMFGGWVSAEMEKTAGAVPIGGGLEVWLRNAPGFNADKIHAPLRLEIDSPSSFDIFRHWEMFKILRRLNKPVELYIIPDLDHGAHPLQHPVQRFASATGSVDWMDFWLNGNERTEAVAAAGETKEKLAAQYARWHKLRELRDADLKSAQIK